ncbi:MAG: DUF1049 domain-containing protein [Neisseriaceae bacterium]|jgi:uncharacterized integral membrane protein|nr:MAG: DUF1049 domain-containing protein [Neisseriaceae bacterium]
MRVFKLIVNLIVFLFLLVVAINNMESVKLNFLGLYTVDIPLIIALITFMFLGFIFGLFFNFTNNFRLKSQISRLNKELSLAKAEHRSQSDSKFTAPGSTQSINPQTLEK